MHSMRSALALAAVGSLALVLVACGTPRGAARPDSGSSTRDGVGANPPPNLAQLPDAEPRLEPQRSGGPNRPYEVFGRSYTPLTGDVAFSERGLASWYGRKFHGRPTSSGEPYDMYAMTAAHKTMPIPSYARVRNPANGRSVIVRINDRGPFHAGRVIDLSYAAALKLGVLGGVAPVEVERITQAAIRTGAWRDGGSPRALAAAPSGTQPKKAATANTRPTDAPSATTASAASGTASAAPSASAAGAVATVPAEDPAPSADDGATPDAPRAAVRPITTAAPGFWLQLGVFRERDGALDFQRKVERELDWLTPLMAVFADRDLHRLQAGPYASRPEAAGAAERLRGTLQLVPLIVERR